MKNRLDHNQVPWLVLSWMICLPVVTQAGATDLTSYKPSWQVGQTWHVDVQTLTQPPAKPQKELKNFTHRKITRCYAFTVEAVEEVDGELCYRIRPQCVTIDGNEVKTFPQIEGAPRRHRTFYKLFNRVDDYSLKMVQRFDAHTGEMEVSRKYPRGPVQATSWMGSLPLCFPVFSEEAQKYQPPDRAEPNALTARKGDQSWQQHKLPKDVWMVNETEKPALNITLEYPGTKMVAERAEQIWIEGMPWPILTEYKYGPNPPVLARLVRVNGSPVTAMPKPQSKQE